MPVKRSLNSYFEDIKQVNPDRNISNKNNYEIEGLFKQKLVGGKATTVLRFLPPHPAENKAFVENRNHMFQLENGMWFGCDCAKKYNDPCPICDYNSKVWNKYGRTDEARALVKDKWKPKFYSNVYIVKNPNQPETEGKVYRLEYGRAIMKFISDAMAGRDDAELGKIPGINPFSWWGPNDPIVQSGEERAGANFVWESIQGSNGPNYSTSHFSNPRRICKLNAAGQLEEMTEAEMDAVEAQLYTLADVEKPKESLQSYNDILARYERKAGEPLFAKIDGNSDYTTTTNIVREVEDDFIPTNKQNSSYNTTMSNSLPFDDESNSNVTVADDTDDFFAKLANG